MTVYSTPYKSGVIDSVSGPVVTVSGITTASSDVGRILLLSSGAGELQHREIIARTATTYTLAHSFDTNPFIDTSSDSRGTDVNPSAADTFVVSYDVDDLIAGDADLTLTNDKFLSIAALTAQDGAVIHFKNYNIELSSGTFKSGNGGGSILGYYRPVAGEDGYVVDSCTVRDLTAGFGSEQMRVDGGSFYLFDMYGGKIQIPTSNFWRCYKNGSSTGYQSRLFDVTIQGGMAGRIRGERSIADFTAIDGTSTSGFFNLPSEVHRINQSVFDSTQGTYVNLNVSGAGRAKFPRISNVTTLIGMPTDFSVSGGLVYEVEAVRSEVEACTNFINSIGAGDATHTVRLGNLVEPRFIKQDLTLLTGNISVDLIDVGSAIVESQGVTTGVFAPYFARSVDVPSTAGAKTLADGTDYSPYNLTAYKYGYDFVTQIVSLDNTFGPDITMLVDRLITETDKSVVDAYPYVYDPYDTHDALCSWLEDNKTDELEKIANREGASLLIGSKDIVFDSAASILVDFDGTTITAKSHPTTLWNGSITTTGDVFADNIDFDGITIDGNLVFTVAGTYTMYGCTIKSMTNISGGAVTVEADSACVFTITPDPGENITIVTAPVPITITVLDQATKTAIVGAAVYIEAGATGGIAQGTTIATGVTDASGVFSSSVSLTSNQSIQNSSIRKASGSPNYTAYQLDGTISSASGITITALMISEDS